MNDDLKKELAEYAHKAWSGWMNYLFEKSSENEDGTICITLWAVERWKRQASISYSNLPENEKKSDRNEANKMIAIFKKYKTN